MPSKSVSEALFDIRDNIRFAQEFTSGLTLSSFMGDRKTFYAATRCLEIVSEASRRLPASLRARHPAVPWKAVMGAGNVYRHNYDNVAEEFVWHTVQQSVAPLLAVVEDEIARLPTTPA